MRLTLMIAKFILAHSHPATILCGTAVVCQIWNVIVDHNHCSKKRKLHTMVRSLLPFSVLRVESLSTYPFRKESKEIKEGRYGVSGEEGGGVGCTYKYIFSTSVAKHSLPARSV